LEYIHSKKFSHRDLKPENIFVFNDQPKIADFGYAGKLIEGRFQNNFVGTDNYVCPEIQMN